MAIWRIHQKAKHGSYFADRQHIGEKGLLLVWEQTQISTYSNHHSAVSHKLNTDIYYTGHTSIASVKSVVAVNLVR